MECVRACGPGALLHDERDKEYEVEVGAVVLATGFDLHDPGAKSEYGYRRYPNVLSAPRVRAHAQRLRPHHRRRQARQSDGRHPKKIAFIQCVGSRDQEHEYCSSVCCMYANKQAMLTIDHVPDCQPEVFLMDMRAQGKGFDAFYQRALDMGVELHPLAPLATSRKTRSRNDLLITWEDEAGKLHESSYDMVVLSRRPRAGAQGAGGGRPPRHRPQPPRLLPAATSSRRSDDLREGVFVAGPFGEPKDIPDSVAQASAAAAQVMTGLADSRGTLTVEPGVPGRARREQARSRASASSSATAAPTSPA